MFMCGPALTLLLYTVFAQPLFAAAGHMAAMATTVPLPPTWKTRAKCGLREYFFQNRKCPWELDRAPTVELNVNGILRVQTKPESCWYDPNRYALRYVPHGHSAGSTEQLLLHTDHGHELSQHPQCHLSMELSVLDGLQGSFTSSDFINHLEKAEVGEWIFVRPRMTPTAKRNNRDTHHPYDGNDDGGVFERVPSQKNWGKLEMGPRLDSRTREIKYLTTGLPSYLHTDDQSESQAPTYCGSQHSNTTRWIQFKKTGTFVVAYTNVHVGRCVMGVSYDEKGLVHMLGVDRWILVHVSP